MTSKSLDQLEEDETENSEKLVVPIITLPFYQDRYHRSTIKHQALNGLFVFTALSEKVPSYPQHNYIYPVRNDRIKPRDVAVISICLLESWRNWEDKIG